MKTHLLLIDALNLIRRIYAVDSNQTHHSDEQMIKASCARVSHACKKLQEFTNATHAVAVFDGDTSWRYHFYKEYKHSRSPMPEQLKQALAQFKAAIEETGIVTFSPENDEADDIIATLANKAANSKVPSTIVSTDKGFLPLQSGYTQIYDYFSKCYLDDDYIWQKFALPKHKLYDYWALAGDKTNDIPGVKGIGKKTAQHLLTDHASIENALTDDSLKTSIKQKLTADMPMFVISKQLVTLRTDIHLGFNLRQLRLI